MFVEKQPTKIPSSIGAICKNGLNTGFLYVAPTELMVFASWDYKHFTPAGLKTLYFKGFTKKTNRAKRKLRKANYPYQVYQSCASMNR